MTYPQQYPPQGYQQPGFPQAPPPSPGYPPLPPQAYQQAPPQGYAQPPAQQGPPLARGTLDDFFSQPSAGGGAALKFPTPGTTHVGVVSRQITMGDVQQQTQPGSGQPAFYKDGRPKFVMKVPLQLPAPTADNPDGLAQWYCSGGARDELVRAMAEAGAPEGPPEAGAAIRITFTGTRNAGTGMNPAKVFQVQYVRPNGAAPAAQPSPVAPAQQQAQIPQQTAPPPAPLPEAQVSAPAPAAQPAAPAPVTGEQATPLSDEQQKLLASLTGQPTG